MQKKIVSALERIEKDHWVRIILSSESGSRAWGFPSNDSDYDVRFIYVHNRDWYLTIAEKRDVIELPVDDELDVNGWDLKKTLQLMRKSNSPLMEWLSSPIQYKVWPEAYSRLAELSKLSFMPETSCHHYLSMAKRSIEQVDGHKRVKLKTYMYAIRSILCCQWIIAKSEQPPMRIENILAEFTDDQIFKDKVIQLIDKKKENPEKYKVERSEIIEDYVQANICELQAKIPGNPPRPKIELFDNSFRSIIENSGI
ncbi:MAG: nucleotidyltransferase domain-containing protein [Desulfobacteraceae bacterium]|jgi:predicted nucleotidyltransferase